MDSLPWAGSFQRRCTASREIRGVGTIGGTYGGRCELVRGHDPEIDHAFERGFDTPRWSTDWTDGSQAREQAHAGVECEEIDRQQDVMLGELARISQHLTNAGVQPRGPNGDWRLVEATEELIQRKVDEWR